MNKERREQEIRDKINTEKYEIFSHYSPDESVRCMCQDCSEKNLLFCSYTIFIMMEVNIANYFDVMGEYHFWSKASQSGISL